MHNLYIYMRLNEVFTFETLKEKCFLCNKSGYILSSLYFYLTLNFAECLYINIRFKRDFLRDRVQV